MRGLLLIVGLLACGKAGHRGGPDIAPDPALQHVGAWFGSGPGFPGERLCLIFCPSGLLFAAEVPCDEVEAPGFRAPFSVERSGEAVVARKMFAPSQPPLSFTFAVQPDGSALAAISAQQNLPFDKVADLSPLCMGAPEAPAALPASAPAPAPADPAPPGSPAGG